MSLNRRDFLGGIAALLPVVAMKPIPTLLGKVDESKPIVIERPQIITPEQIRNDGIPVIDLGNEVMIQLRQGDVTTVARFLCTQIEFEICPTYHEYKDMRGNEFSFTGIQDVDISICGKGIGPLVWM